MDLITPPPLYLFLIYYQSFFRPPCITAKLTFQTKSDNQTKPIQSYQEKYQPNHTKKHLNYLKLVPTFNMFFLTDRIDKIRNSWQVLFEKGGRGVRRSSIRNNTQLYIFFVNFQKLMALTEQLIDPIAINSPKLIYIFH